MGDMTRTAGRELALRLVYELTFSALRAEELLSERLTPEGFAALAGEDSLYDAFSDAQLPYIRALVSGVDAHGAELDGYISRYAVGWKFSRISRVTASILRLAMFELLYMPEIPNGAAINEAVELTKRYETKEAAAFVNGILGSFVRKECGGFLPGEEPEADGAPPSAEEPEADGAPPDTVLSEAPAETE